MTDLTDLARLAFVYGAPEGNWLPAPGGAFDVALRTYLPLAPIRDGTWFPPGIERAGEAERPGSL